MTILEALDEANESADLRSFRFANLSEFNKFMESFSFEDYPCNVIAPVETRQEWESNRIHEIAVIQGWMLLRIESDTTDLKTREAEKLYIQPMRALAKKFLRYLLDTDIIDPEVEKVTSSIKPEYALLSARVFGVSYTMNLPIAEGIC